MGGGQSTNSGSKVITEHDRAVADLKSQMARLDRFQKQMLVKNKEEELAIKKLLRDGRRDRALSLLKLKKLRERQVSNCQASYFKLEELVMNIESSQINQDVLKGLQIGNESLKQLNSIMSIEAVEALLDETNDAIEQQREIDALLAGGATSSIEEELESELAELVSESGQQSAEPPGVVAAPSRVPTTSAPSQEELLDALAQVSAPTHPVSPQIAEKREADLDEILAISAPSHKVVVTESLDVELVE